MCFTWTALLLTKLNRPLLPNYFPDSWFRVSSLAIILLGIWSWLNYSFGFLFCLNSLVNQVLYTFGMTESSKLKGLKNILSVVILEKHVRSILEIQKNNRKCTVNFWIPTLNLTSNGDQMAIDSNEVLGDLGTLFLEEVTKYKFGLPFSTSIGALTW